MAKQEEPTPEQGGSKSPMAACVRCGRQYARQSQVERLRKKLGGDAPMIEYCPACRRRLYAEGLCEAQRTADKHTGGS